ncbi:sensor histidine kinase [Cystobacter ferrugineus]|uniref:histidine kinase n=1 Tax=Cystobacter ferrugineus TaxID=83449 RepID=A0A1L9BEM2_9BACT|nr:PAS domain-containing sensor histidine kinase [Cystobacter ferrugineus]OJH40700.1 histidine kinase [Cystobacter ferrugineus]
MKPPRSIPSGEFPSRSTSASTPTDSRSREVVPLEEEHERLLALADVSSQIFWTSAGIEKSVGGLPGWMDFTGQPAEALRGRKWLDFVHSEDRPHVEQALARAFDERVAFSVSFRLRRSDGQYIWMMGRAVPLLDADGTVREWVGTSTNIHAFRLAEERASFLARAGELLSASLDYDATLAALARLPVPALADWCILDVLGPNGQFIRAQVVAADPSLEALVQEVRGLSPLPHAKSSYPPTVALVEGRASLVRDVTDELMRQAAQNAWHLSVMRRVGIRSLLTVPLLAHGHILGSLTLAASTSDRRYAEEDLRFAQELAHRAALSVDNARLYREAREAIRLRDEFLSIASHELKTPLTPLSLKLQSLERAAEAHPDSSLAPLVRSTVQAGRQQLRKLTTLMNGLLDVSLIVSGCLELRREEVDLRCVVREVVARLTPRAGKFQSPLVIEADAPVVGQWDRSRLEQVVTNLLDNALKYGAGSPVVVRVSVENGFARLSVRDKGIGIAPEQSRRIFERYARAVSERHYGGLGLGLYITRAIVEAEGGRVHVHSALGRGATFVVELPLRA